MGKTVIVGAGIAGLTAGIYAQLSGFKTEIFEQHIIPGGNCTSWSRKGFFFEGGMHWLTGSKDGMDLNTLWRETGALGENNPIHLKDPFMSYIDCDGSTTSVYRDIEKWRAHLIATSPEDKSAIDELCADIEKLSVFSMPITDIKGLKVKNKAPGFGFGAAMKMMPSLSTMMRYSKISMPELLGRFSSEKIRNLLSSVVPMTFSASALLITLGTLMTGDGGYAEGGALRMARNMADRYESLGGVINYKSQVQNIVISDGKAKGINVDGRFIEADSVIIASDTIQAMNRLFDNPLDDKWISELMQSLVPLNGTFCCFGIDYDLSDMPETFMFKLDEPFEYAGGANKITILSLNNYAAYNGYAPKGKTAATMAILGDSYDYWSDAKADGIYAEKKKELAEKLIAIYEKHLPFLKGKFEVWDIATPVTYERYCGTYRGGFMSVMAKGNKQRTYPSKSSTVSGLYFAGQQLVTPGGMPAALATGRQAAQHLCKDNGVIFCNN